MFLLVPLSKSKFFTRVSLVSHSRRSCSTRVALVSHSCCSRLTSVASVALVLHSCPSCRTGVTHVWHLCCKLDQIQQKESKLVYDHQTYFRCSLYTFNLQPGLQNPGGLGVGGGRGGFPNFFFAKEICYIVTLILLY